MESYVSISLLTKMSKLLEGLLMSKLISILKAQLDIRMVQTIRRALERKEILICSFYRYFQQFERVRHKGLERALRGFWKAILLVGNL